jgi:hypothetical protein
MDFICLLGRRLECWLRALNHHGQCAIRYWMSAIHVFQLADRVAPGSLGKQAAQCAFHAQPPWRRSRVACNRPAVWQKMLRRGLLRQSRETPGGASNESGLTKLVGETWIARGGAAIQIYGLLSAHCVNARCVMC